MRAILAGLIVAAFAAPAWAQDLATQQMHDDRLCESVAGGVLPAFHDRTYDACSDAVQQQREDDTMFRSDTPGNGDDDLDR